MRKDVPGVTQWVLWLWVGFNADCRIAGLKTWPGPFTIDSLGAFFVFFGLSLFHFHF